MIIAHTYQPPQLIDTVPVRFFENASAARYEFLTQAILAFITAGHMGLSLCESIHTNPRPNPNHSNRLPEKSHIIFYSRGCGCGSRNSGAVSPWRKAQAANARPLYAAWIFAQPDQGLGESAP